MKRIDEQGCKVCGGQRLIYSTKIRGSFRIRYFRCVDCELTSKTMQRIGLSVYQMLPIPQLSTDDVTPIIESVQATNF